MDEAGMMTRDLRRTVLVVALLNLGYFVVEFAVATTIGSVSLFADSIDFLEDTSVNLLIMVALTWSPEARARAGMSLAIILLMPAVGTAWALWSKLATSVPPEPFALSLTGLGALAVNVCCASLLVRFRAHRGSLTRAAFLSARNDAAANVGIVAAGLLTAFTYSVWPDIIVGVAIAAMNVDAARDVWRAARKEHRSPS